MALLHEIQSIVHSGHQWLYDNSAIAQRFTLEPNRCVTSQWQKQIVSGMPIVDKRTIYRVRNFLARNGSKQRWQYVGAGVDIFPTIIAPADTTHWYVDPDYGPERRFRSADQIERCLTDPYNLVGSTVHTDKPWDVAMSTGYQRLTVDGSTKIYCQTEMKMSYIKLYQN
ncbi:MAG: hypothetical protein WCO06_02525 [Candidatus Roizmanbacteria bacterium]